MCIAVSSVVLLTAGILSVSRSAETPSTALRTDSAAGSPAPPPQTPAAQIDLGPAVASPISLAELARGLGQSRPTTSTTRPRSTSTTRKPARTTSAPATVTTKPAAAPAGAAIAPPPAPTTTTRPTASTLLPNVVPPAAAVSQALTHSDSGVASWFGAPAATCAHRTLPMGTMVKVTRTETGASATCKVNDRGPTLETGRLIDLSTDTFEKLAPRSVGLVDVTIQW